MAGGQAIAGLHHGSATAPAPPPAPGPHLLRATQLLHRTHEAGMQGRGPAQARRLAAAGRGQVLAGWGRRWRRLLQYGQPAEAQASVQVQAELRAQASRGHREWGGCQRVGQVRVWHKEAGRRQLWRRLLPDCRGQQGARVCRGRIRDLRMKSIEAERVRSVLPAVVNDAARAHARRGGGGRRSVCMPFRSTFSCLVKSLATAWCWSGAARLASALTRAAIVGCGAPGSAHALTASNRCGPSSGWEPGNRVGPVARQSVCRFRREAPQRWSRRAGA